MGAFDPRAKGDVRRKPDCVACTQEKAREAYRRKKASAPLAPAVKTAAKRKVKVEYPRSTEPKRCKLCKEVKPAAEYHTEKRTPSGLSAKCKDCARARLRERARAKRQRLRAQYGATAAGQRGQSVQFERKLGKFQDEPARLARPVARARCRRCGGVMMFSDHDGALVCMCCSARIYAELPRVSLGQPEAEAV